MKNVKMFLAAASAVAVSAAMLSGCSHPGIPVQMKVAGEIKMTGVSKLALVGFNSLPDDPFTGVIAADAATVKLVERAVAAAFYRDPTYQIASLTEEQAVAALQGSARPDRRYDGFIYGRTWWKMTPETDGTYTDKFTLNTTQYVPYTQKVLGKDVPAIAPVITHTVDVLKVLNYRNCTASLMLSLSIYRLDNNGNVSKITDTYQVTEDGFTLANGKMHVDTVDVGGKPAEGRTAYQRVTGESKPAPNAAKKEEKKSAFGAFGSALGDLGGAVAAGVSEGLADLDEDSKKPVPRKFDKTGNIKPDLDVNGRVLLAQKTVTIPSELQAKLMLAAKVSGDLAAKVAPSTKEVDAPWGLDRVWMFGLGRQNYDSKLTELFANKAWASLKAYCAYVIRQRVGKENAASVESIAEEKATYVVPPSEKVFKKGTEDLAEALADEDVQVYLYAYGLACEASGDLDSAMDAYVESFDIKPEANAAVGIGRCNEALGQAARRNKVSKAQGKSAKAASMN